MSELRPFALSHQVVLDLLATGQAQAIKAVKHQPLPGELPATVPYAVGEQFWGRESVAKQAGVFYYEADGREPGRYYQKNYHMPREACRITVVVTAECLEQRGDEWVAVVDLRRVVEPAQVFVLDFEQVAEAGMRTRHRPTFPVPMLDFATDPEAARCALVRTYARYYNDAWWLPLVEREVRHWLRSLRFSKAPSIQVGGVDVVCGKEVSLC